MRIPSVCANASILRIFSHTQRAKWLLPPNKALLFNNKVLQTFHGSITRIICTDSNLYSCNYAIQDSDKQPTVDNFLKDNFNISDTRCITLVTLPNECNNLEVFWTNEFKYILSRSPFLYDVNVLENSTLSQYRISTLPVNECNDLVCSGGSFLMNQDPLYQCSKVYLQKSGMKGNDTGKATEEQLLQIIDRLTYSLINFFEESHDYSVYHKNIIFQNNIKGVTIKGLKSYIQSMYLMKFYGYFHFAQVKVELLKVTHHIEDGTVRVRWRVNGLPRHKVLIMVLNYRSMNWKQLPDKETEWLDGFSIFSVDQDGLIYKHVCDKMIPDDDTLLAKKVDIKTKVLSLLGLAPRNPTAGTLNAWIPCCKTPDVVACKKLT